MRKRRMIDADILIESLEAAKQMHLKENEGQEDRKAAIVTIYDTSIGFIDAAVKLAEKGATYGRNGQTVPCEGIAEGTVRQTHRTRY